MLDTSVIIEVFKNKNTVADRLDTIAEIYVPVIVVGELYYGAYRSANPEKHILQVQSFLRNCQVLLSDVSTAEASGVIKAALMAKGRPIPENDIWIAAVARQYSLPLFTADNHFTEIDCITLFK